MEEISIFDITLGNEFYGFIALFANLKDVLSWLVIFGKLIENLIDNKWFWTIWEHCEYILGISKVFVKLLRNWTVFWFHVNYELFMFLPLGHDMWLPGDYPTRCCSLCDIGILAPHLCCESMSSWHNRCLRVIPNVFIAACHVALGWIFRF